MLLFVASCVLVGICLYVVLHDDAVWLGGCLGGVLLITLAV